MVWWKVKQYDWFYTEGFDLFPGQKFSKLDAEIKLLEKFLNCKCLLEGNKYIIIGSDLIEGTYFEIVKERNKCI